MKPQGEAGVEWTRFARFSMAGKAALYVCIVVGLLGSLLTLAHLLSQGRLAKRGLEQHAQAMAALTAESCVESLERLDIGSLREILRHVRAQDGVACVYVTDGDGLVVTDGTRHNVYRGKSLDAIEDCSRGTSPYVVTGPVEHDGKTLGQVRIGISREPSEAAMAATQRRSIAIAGLFLIGAMILAALASRRMLRPLEDLCEATRAVASGRFDTRVPVVRADEIGSVASSFNAMAEALAATTVSRDELRRINEELDAARAQAIASARAKSEFLANMSHEIRTPMTAILGYAELLLESTREEEDQDAARTIHENGRHLLAVLDDILDLSKFEAGRMTIEILRCSPAQLARDVIDLMRVRARSKEIDLRLRLADGLPEEIETDPTRLRQVLVNLIGNAIKFTASGSVSLSVEAAGDDDELIQFVVEDTGIGMDLEQVSRLFEPFSQGDERTTRKFGGTGLGLTISRRFVELMSGTIDARSVEGEGSRFTVRLPVRSQIEVATTAGGEIEKEQAATELNPGPEPLGDDDPLQGARILIAEDGQDNQRLIAGLLRRYGSLVEIADNGRAAIDVATASERDGHPFDLVLMDMQMPEMDGYMATEHLRNQGFERPIVALTAHAMAGDRARCLRSGCNEYATKPIQRERLVNILRKCLRCRPDDGCPSGPCS